MTTAIECARLLVQAGNAIPVFLKERVKQWRYEGMYQPVAFDEDLHRIRTLPYRRRSIVGVLYLEPRGLHVEESTVPDIDGAQYTASEGDRKLALHYFALS